MKRRNFISRMLGIAAIIPLQSQATIPLKSTPSVDPLLLLTNHIAGYQYYQGQYIEPKIQINDPVNLRPQPNNKYDNLAIEVYWNNQKLGYIPRQMLDRGENLQAHVSQINPSQSPWQRLQINIHWQN